MEWGGDTGSPLSGPVLFSWQVCPTLWTTGLEVPPSDGAKEENWGSLLLNLEGSFTHVEPTCGHEL